MLLLVVYCLLLAEPALGVSTKIPPRTDDLAINTVFSPPPPPVRKFQYIPVCATQLSPLQMLYYVAFGF